MYTGKLKGKNFEKHAMKHMFTTFLLWFISKKPSHGYDMIKILNAEHGSDIVSASNLYPILKELTKRGLISSEKKMTGKRAKKLYNITSQGKQALLDAKKMMRAKPLKLAFLRDMTG